MCLPYCQVSPGCRSPGKPLGCSKRRLYLVPFTYSPPFLLGVPVVVLLGRPAQWTVVALDIVVLEILPVCFPKIVFVNLHLSWEHAETFSVEFYLHGKVGRFVIGIPAEMVHISVTVHDTGPDLRTKLDLGFCLAPDNGAEVRLVDTDDAVGAAADILLEHHLLLRVHLEHCPQALVIMAAEARKKIARLLCAQKIKKYLEISLQTTYLGQFCLADKFLPLAFFLDQQDERTPGFHTVSLWFPDLVTCTELVKQAVYQLAAVLQKVRVCRIANLGVTTCGITLHRAAVVIAVLVGAFLLRLAPVRFGQHQGQHVEEVLVKALADQNEQLGYEHGLFRELGKPKQILHVRILLDSLESRFFKTMRRMGHLNPISWQCKQGTLHLHTIIGQQCIL